jgi:hypothetical protein
MSCLPAPLMRPDRSSAHPWRAPRDDGTQLVFSYVAEYPLATNILPEPWLRDQKCQAYSTT